MPEANRPKWKFHCFLDHRGKDVLADWHRTLSTKGRANFARARDQLKDQPKTSWDRPHASPLGNHIYVIRFKDENRTQHRAFGHFADEHHAFVITLYGEEKDGCYSPSNYSERASLNKDVCDRDFAGRTKPCFSPGGTNVTPRGTNDSSAG